MAIALSHVSHILLKLSENALQVALLPTTGARNISRVHVAPRILGRHVLRHHPYGILESLPLVAEPDPDYFTVVAKLLRESCNLVTWNVIEYSVLVQTLSFIFFRKKIRGALVSRSVFYWVGQIELEIQWRKRQNHAKI